jgi:hypothetical protein
MRSSDKQLTVALSDVGPYPKVGSNIVRRVKMVTLFDLAVKFAISCFSKIIEIMIKISYSSTTLVIIKKRRAYSLYSLDF